MIYMDIIWICLAIIITTAVILSMTLLFFRYFYLNIYLAFKKKNIPIDFQTSLDILKIIINTELDAYENDIFNTKGSITNSNFDNYYKDITNKIVTKVSPELIRHLSFYITEDMVYIIIARTVKKFLTEKINGTL